MKLKIYDRLLLMGILPAQGSYLDLQILVKLRANLSLTEEELVKYEVNEDKESQQTHWNDKLEEELGYGDVEIGPRAASIIHETLVEMDSKKTLKPNMMGLYETFVVDKTG